MMRDTNRFKWVRRSGSVWDLQWGYVLLACVVPCTEGEFDSIGFHRGFSGRFLFTDEPSLEHAKARALNIIVRGLQKAIERVT